MIVKRSKINRSFCISKSAWGEGANLRRSVIVIVSLEDIFVVVIINKNEAYERFFVWNIFLQSQSFQKYYYEQSKHRKTLYAANLIFFASSKIENREGNIFVQSWKGLQKCKRRSIWIGGKQNGS